MLKFQKTTEQKDQLIMNETQKKKVIQKMIIQFERDQALYLGRPNPEKQREYHLQNNPPELIKSTSRQVKQKKNRLLYVKLKIIVQPAREAEPYRNWF